MEKRRNCLIEDRKKLSGAIAAAFSLATLVGQIQDLVAGPKNQNPKQQTVSAPSHVEYIVKKGDTISEIAKSYNLKIEEIKKYNPEIKDINKISIGQKIRLSHPSGLENKFASQAITTGNVADKYRTYLDGIFANDSNEILLAKLIYAEGSICSKQEMTAIAYSIVNRSNDGEKWNGEGNIRDVMLDVNLGTKTRRNKKGEVISERKVVVPQYSCFLNNDPTFEVITNPDRLNAGKYAECLDAAQGVISGKYSDPVNGATNYCTRKVNPSWTSKMTEVPVDKSFYHRFFK